MSVKYNIENFLSKIDAFDGLIQSFLSSYLFDLSNDLDIIEINELWVNNIRTEVCGLIDIYNPKFELDLSFLIELKNILENQIDINCN